MVCLYNVMLQKENSELRQRVNGGGKVRVERREGEGGGQREREEKRQGEEERQEGEEERQEGEETIKLPLQVCGIKKVNHNV